MTVYATFKQTNNPTTRKLLSNVLVIATQANPETVDRLTGTAPGTTRDCCSSSRSPRSRPES